MKDKIKIQLSPTASQSAVYLNGEVLKGVRRINVAIAGGGIAHVNLELITQDITIEGEAFVTQEGKIDAEPAN